MKNLFTLFLLLTLSGSISILSAQTVFACQDYNTTTGEPIKTGSTWTIQPAGGNIYLLYKHSSSRNIPSQVVYYIDRKAGGSYTEEVATEYVNMNGKTFTVLDYKFMKAGDYKIGVHNLDGSLLAETYITVNMASGSTTTTTTSTTKPSTSSTGSVDTYYYADSKVIFCETVENNNAVNAGTSFTIPAGGGYLQVQVNNGKAMKTTKLFVDVYRKPKGSTEYSEFVETMEHPIETSWDRPYFKYTFTTAGDYVFDVYNADDVYINSGYITINMAGSSSSSSSTSRPSSTSSTTKGVDTYYYADSKVIFCESVENNIPKNAGTSFTIPTSGASVQVQVDNGKALKTTTLIVKIYKKPKGSSDYSQFVETKEYPIEAVWDRPYFKYTFYSGGDYVFDVYNGDNVYINSGYVSINVK